MKKVEVAALSQKQALARAAQMLNVAVEELTVIEEYEPDEKDAAEFAQYQEAHPEDASTGELGLFVVERGMGAARKAAQEWIQGLVERFQPGATCQIEVEEEGLRAMLDSGEPSILIGKQGQTLAALQHVVNRVVPRLVQDCPPIILDTGDYRTRKEERLEQMARRAARTAVQRRRSQRLPPMNSVDRKFVHNLLKDMPGIRTESTGAEPDRCVMIHAEGARGGGRGERGGRGRNDRGDRGRDEAPRPAPAFKPEPSAETRYEEVEIEERRSLLPQYNEAAVDRELLREDRPFVDELE